jgi:hypothetical protein
MREKVRTKRGEDDENQHTHCKSKRVRLRAMRYKLILSSDGGDSGARDVDETMVATTVGSGGVCV